MVRCALFCMWESDWFLDSVLIAPGLTLCAAPAAAVGMGELPNPYRLPESSDFNVALLCGEFLKWQASQGLDHVVRMIGRLRSLGCRIVALDGHDCFSLSIPPGIVDLVDIVIKAQGLYKDRDLYNYRVGPFFPGGNWTSKTRPRRVRYEDRHLSKLRLSVPCFLQIDASIRHAIRTVKPGISTPQRQMRRAAEACIATAARVGANLPAGAGLEAHLVGGLTHAQRLELVRRLRAISASGAQGITYVPPVFYGTAELTTDDGTSGDWEESDLRNAAPGEHGTGPGIQPPYTTIQGDLVTVRASHVAAMKSEIERRNLATQAVSRLRFRRELARHALVFAPSGYGEITFRHGEALASGRALVAQRLDHVETMFPFSDRENVIFVRPDLHDVEEVLHAYRRGELDADLIGRAGLTAWQAWSAQWRALLWSGITRHVLQELTGMASNRRLRPVAA